MPHTKSAWKKMRQIEKRRRANRAVAKTIKLKRKTLTESLKGGDAAKVEGDAKATVQYLDRAATKGYIHPNKAARLKSRLVKRMRSTQAAPAK